MRFSIYKDKILTALRGHIPFMIFVWYTIFFLAICVSILLSTYWYYQIRGVLRADATLGGEEVEYKPVLDKDALEELAGRYRL